MQKKWSIFDLFAVTACVVLWCTIHGPSRQDYVSYLYLLAIGGLATSSFLQIKRLLFSPEGHEIAAISRHVWWMLLNVRLSAVILLVLGSRWPSPGLWFSNSDPPPLFDTPFDVGTGLSFAICNAVGRSILPVGMLLSLLPLWSTPPRTKLSLRKQRMGEMMQVALALVTVVIVAYSTEGIGALVSMGVVAIDQGISHRMTLPDQFDRWGNGVASLAHGANAGMAFLVAALLGFGFCFARRRRWQIFGWLTFVVGLGMAAHVDWKIRTEFAPSISISHKYFAEPLNWRVFLGVGLNALVFGWIVSRVLIQRFGNREFEFPLGAFKKLLPNPWLSLWAGILLAITLFTRNGSISALFGGANPFTKWWDLNFRTLGSLSERMQLPFGNFGDFGTIVWVIVFLAAAFQARRLRQSESGSTGMIRTMSISKTLAIWVATSALLVVGCDLIGWSARTSMFVGSSNLFLDPVTMVADYNRFNIGRISLFVLAFWMVGNLISWAWRGKKRSIGPLEP